MLKLNSSVPLYEQLMNAIRADIDRGIFKSGSKMPSEAELEEQYKVSRITVRRAIKELCDEDVLVKKQGKGTFVLQNITPIPFSCNLGFHDVFESKGMAVSSKIVEKRILKVKKGLAEDLKIKTDDDVLLVKRVLYVASCPKMVDVVYLPVKLYPGIYEKVEGDFSLFRLLKSVYGVESFQQYKVMKVKGADNELAELLNVKENTPLFDMYKVSYMSDGSPIHISISYISGDAASYVISGEENNRQFYSGFNWKV